MNEKDYDPFDYKVSLPQALITSEKLVRERANKHWCGNCGDFYKKTADVLLEEIKRRKITIDDPWERKE